jgi:hypothetical protein
MSQAPLSTPSQYPSTTSLANAESIEDIPLASSVLGTASQLDASRTTIVPIKKLTVSNQVTGGNVNRSPLQEGLMTTTDHDQEKIMQLFQINGIIEEQYSSYKLLLIVFSTTSGLFGFLYMILFFSMISWRSNPSDAEGFGYSDLTTQLGIVDFLIIYEALNVARMLGNIYIVVSAANAYRNRNTSKAKYVKMFLMVAPLFELGSIVIEALYGTFVSICLSVFNIVMYFMMYVRTNRLLALLAQRDEVKKGNAVVLNESQRENRSQIGY